MVWLAAVIVVVWVALKFWPVTLGLLVGYLTWWVVVLVGWSVGSGEAYAWGIILLASVAALYAGFRTFLKCAEVAWDD